jgi:hypothetical protein
MAMIFPDRLSDCENASEGERLVYSFLRETKTRSGFHLLVHAGNPRKRGRFYYLLQAARADWGRGTLLTS